MTHSPAVALALFARLALAQADGGAGAALRPMPSDAECRPLGTWKGALSFGPGEVLEYELDAMGAKAGRMVMTVKPFADSRLPVEVAVETNTFFSKIRRVNGAGTSYLSPKTLRPARYHEDATENDVHRVADVTFAAKVAHLTSTINGQTGRADLPFAADGLDVGGAIYLMRQLPLRPGQSICFDIYGIRRMWRVWGAVEPREHVSLPIGEFDALHLAGQAARLDIPAVRREVHVWISDDARRLPLAALGMIDIGAIRATLTGFQRPTEQSGRAENKANIKW